MASSTPTIHERYAPRENALNAVRLGLALLVIVWHSFPLTGGDVGFAPLRQLLGEIAVDGFFAISGFLIVGSWLRRPQAGAFLLARALRIFPAFWVCLVVVALAVAPVATMLVSGGGYAVSGANLTYVLHNAALRIFQPDIAGTPLGVPMEGVWNGSLWTLWWEFLCYLAVLVLGVVGLLRRRHTIAIAFVAALLGLAATAYGPIDHFLVEHGARFGTMFLAGAVLQRYARSIPLTWPLVGAAAAIALATMWLPDYRILGALPLAYAVFGVGALVRSPRWRFEQDISYGTYIYAFPMQQLLASAGAAAWGVPAFLAASVAATLPLAAASWFLVERPALRLKPRGRKPSPAAVIG